MIFLHPTVFGSQLHCCKAIILLVLWFRLPFILDCQLFKIDCQAKPSSPPPVPWTTSKQNRMKVFYCIHMREKRKPKPLVLWQGRLYWKDACIAICVFSEPPAQLINFQIGLQFLVDHQLIAAASIRCAGTANWVSSSLPGQLSSIYCCLLYLPFEKWTTSCSLSVVIMVVVIGFAEVQAAVGCPSVCACLRFWENWSYRVISHGHISASHENLAVVFHWVDFVMKPPDIRVLVYVVLFGPN